MSKGCDSNVDCGGRAACLFNAGYTFCCRYFKSAGHPLTAQEAHALSKAGLSIISLVERGFPTGPEYFSLARGAADGRWAYTYARTLGQPQGAPIYFAVDFDCDQNTVSGPIAQYFRGVQASFDGESEPLYPIGVYGSGLVCSWLLRHTSVTYAWLAMSSGWRGSKTFRGWNLRQTGSATACGMRIDEDESQGAGGGWKLS